MALFQKGESGNPAGRPKGLLTGRAKALNALDRVVSQEENIALIETALGKTLREKPMWFFTNIVMPLLPKESKGVLEAGDRVIEWRGLLSTYDESGSSRSDEGGCNGVP